MHTYCPIDITNCYLFKIRTTTIVRYDESIATVCFQLMFLMIANAGHTTLASGAAAAPWCVIEESDCMHALVISSNSLAHRPD